MSEKLFTKELFMQHKKALQQYEIEDNSFYIPDGFTKIDNDALRNARFKHIIIPDGVTEIGNHAFLDCESLINVEIPDSVIEIEVGAFRLCKLLKEVKLPNGITQLPSGIFSECRALKEVNIPDNVTSIGEEAFHTCTSLKNVNIPASVTEIGEGAFCCCKSLRSITIPDSVTEIGKNAFLGCRSLGFVKLSDSVTKIESGMFETCKSLKSIKIPNGVTKIGYEAFCKCKSLQEIHIPNSVTRIESEAFCYCDSLKEIHIPDGVTEIGWGAFDGCESLKSIKIPNSVIAIRTETFKNCKSLESIKIPDSVIEIGDGAFSGCRSLKSIEIPNGVTKIGSLVFRDCENLETIMYKNRNIKPFMNYDCYGVDNFNIVKKLIDHDMLKLHIFPKAVNAAHSGKLDDFCSKYQDFGSLSIPEAKKNYPESVKLELEQAFKENKKTRGVVPKCIDKLVLASHIGNIPAKDLVDSFNLSYTKDVIAEPRPFIPSIICKAYYPKPTCDMLFNKGVLDLVADTLIKYGSDKNIKFKDAADFIVSHPDTDVKVLTWLSKNANEVNLTENTTVADIRKEMLLQENMGEVHKINKEYDIDINECVCNIPATSVKYDNRVSRILDFSKPEDIAIGANLGYATNCCQHLNAAGETAMMHGFLNPDAGFFVIEDEKGNIKAQAEIWLADKNTLVFDNIEFANTSGEDYSKRVDALRGDLAAFAEKSGYKNIVMGCGYNEFKTNEMEKASKPKLKLTAEEVYLMQEDNDAGVEFDNIKQAEEYMTTKKYKAKDFVYSDTGECVYIKHDNQVSPYLMEGYDKSLVHEDIPVKKFLSRRKKEQLEDRVFDAEAVIGNMALPDKEYV